ncbi:MAG TPA: glycosyltransferase family 2 protein, partial [Planctomycetota bacterium]|nr:glycosyltransferase family 2 protein [Planctomycetota bacterium]
RAPVALFVYNRVRHTRSTVEALVRNGQARETDLVVFSDGPKTPESAGDVGHVREYIRSIQGFRSLQIVERASNFGLGASVIDGVTSICEKHGRVIVLEDDLPTAPHFLDFMNLTLNTYQGEERVMQAAGYTFRTSVSVSTDAIFLPLTTSWGWATWQRAWKHFDRDARGYERLAKDEALQRKFNLNGHYDYFSLLRRQRDGKRDGWASLWYLSVFLCDGLVLYPRKTLVRNIGFDGSGANPFLRSYDQEPLDPEFQVQTLPRSIEVTPEAEAMLRSLPRPRMTLGGILRRVGSIFRGRS